MRTLGAAIIFFGGIMVSWPTSHAISMYQATGDDRWFMTIVGAPIMGALLIALGFAMRSRAA